MSDVRLASPQGKWILLTTVLGSSMAMVDSTVVNVALLIVAGLTATRGKRASRRGQPGSATDESTPTDDQHSLVVEGRSAG